MQDPSPPPRRILVVDDHPIIRLGIERLLARECDISICGSTGSPHDALEMMSRTRVDVAVLDLSLNGESGLALVRKMRDASCDVKAIVLSMHEDTLIAKLALDSGARGYVTKAEAPTELVSAIRRVLRGETYISTRMRALVSHDNSRDRERWMTELSARECQVFDLIGEGFSTREIGDRLRISVKTVESHRANIKMKLGLARGDELIRCAALWRAGLRTTL